MPTNMIEQRRQAQASLEGRSFSNKKDVRDPFVFYDTLTLAAAAGSLTLFNNGNSNKALSISNYPYQTLPTGQSFDITGMRISYVGHALMADATHQLMIAWLATSVLQVGLVNQVPKYERTLSALIGGQVQVCTAPAVTVGSRNLSVWTADTVVRFKRKLYIDQNIQLQIKIQQDAAANAALNGDLVRLELIGRQTTLLG